MLPPLLSSFRHIFCIRQPDPHASRRNPSQMDGEEAALRQALAEKQAAVDSQASAVRDLKSLGPIASQAEIDAAVESMKSLKLEAAAAARQLQAAVGTNGGRSGSVSKEEFRQQVVNNLERRLFYTPSFKIYGGVAGLYDYAPPGCAVKSNVLAFWRQMNRGKLMKMAGAVRTRGKGSMCRKKKVVPKTSTTDDEASKHFEKNWGNAIPAIEEVNIFKDDVVIQFLNPKGPDNLDDLRRLADSSRSRYLVPVPFRKRTRMMSRNSWRERHLKLLPMMAKLHR